MSQPIPRHVRQHRDIPSTDSKDHAVQGRMASKCVCILLSEYTIFPLCLVVKMYILTGLLWSLCWVLPLILVLLPVCWRFILNMHLFSIFNCDILSVLILICCWCLKYYSKMLFISITEFFLLLSLYLTLAQRTPQVTQVSDHVTMKVAQSRLWAKSFRWLLGQTGVGGLWFPHSPGTTCSEDLGPPWTTCDCLKCRCW